MRTAILVLGLILGMSACAGDAADVRDARGPDAVGTVVTVSDNQGAIDVLFAPDPGHEYFEGTTFSFAASGGLVDDAGEPVAASDVSVGDRLEVWVEACAESFPVQCPHPLGRLTS